MQSESLVAAIRAIPVNLFPPMLRRTLSVLPAAVFFGCVISGSAVADVAVRVAASIKPVHSLVSAVMEGTGEPHLIMQGTSSPHTFSLRPSDAEVLQNSRIVFLVDELMETSLANSVDTLAHNARIVVLSEAEGLVHRSLREGGAFEAHDHDAGEGHGNHEKDEHSDREEHHGHKSDDDHGHHEHGSHSDESASAHEDKEHAAVDLHLWLDPVNAGAMVRMIAGTLSEADPANAKTYTANAEALLNRLDDLIAEIAEDVAPVRDRPFIVFHDAYRHFEDRFGLTAVGSVVVSAEQTPGVRRIMELRDKIHQLGATCVFAEIQFEPRLVDTIIEGTQAQAGVLDPLGATAESGPGAYFDLIRNMAASFKSCLAPAG